MEEFEKIKQLARSVTEKRTHVRLAFQKLLEALSAPVRDITSDEPDVRAQLYSETEPADPYSDEITHTYYLCLQFRRDAEFRIIKKTVDGYYRPEKSVSADELSPMIIRMLATAIPEALKNICDQLAKRDGNYGETVKLLEDMVSKLE